ncbi:MAG: HAD family hydrolase [Nitrospira sp.]|nr:MAG: HAD family hydrolase [Nitrospira sp.]
MGSIAAILFDLDGVLVDATEWHYVALNRALAVFGFSISRYEHLSAYNGLPTRKKLEMLSVEKGLPVSLHGLIGCLKQIYTREEILSKCRPVFEKEYMSSRLKREGYRLAVCSNSIRDTLELMLRQSGIYDQLEFVISNEDVLRPKPDPEIYLKAMEKLGCGPDEVVVVEDAPHGIESARRSGAHVCSVVGFEAVDYLLVKGFVDQIETQVVTT